MINPSLDRTWYYPATSEPWISPLRIIVTKNVITFFLASVGFFENFPSRVHSVSSRHQTHACCIYMLYTLPKSKATRRTMHRTSKYNLFDGNRYYKSGNLFRRVLLYRRSFHINPLIKNVSSLGSLGIPPRRLNRKWSKRIYENKQY